MSFCQAAFEQSLGRRLSQEEVRSYKAMFSKAYARARQAGYAANDNAALKIGLEILEKEARERKKLKQIEEIASVVKAQELKSKIDEMVRELPSKTPLIKRIELALDSILVGTNQSIKGARASVAAAQQALSDFWKGGLLADIERQGITAQLKNTSKEFWDDVTRALEKFQDYRNPYDTPSNPSDAIKMAALFHKWQTASRDYLRRLGAEVWNADRYITRQSWDQSKIRAAGRDAWIKDAQTHMDWDRSFDGAYAHATDGERLDALGATYSALSSGVHLKLGYDGVKRGRLELNTPGLTPERALRESRLLWFKNADSWLKMNSAYGSSHILSNIISGLDMDARRAVLFDKLGPNHREILADIQAQLIAEHRLEIIEKGDINNIRPGSKFIDARLGQLDNASNVTDNVRVAEAVGTLRNIVGASSYGKLGVTALPDMASYAGAFASQGRGFLSGLTSAFENLMRGRGDAERRIMAQRLGASLEGALGHIISTFRLHDAGVYGRMSRTVMTVLRLSGAHWWNDAMRSGWVHELSTHLADLRDYRWEALDPKFRRELSAYDIDAKDWDFIRAAQVEQLRGRDYLTPESVARLSGEMIRRFSQADADRVALKLQTLFNDSSRDAILEAGAKERVWMYGADAPGTFSGEMRRVLFQLKGYSFAYINRVIGRNLYAHGAKPDVVGLAQIFIASTLLGVAVNALKDILVGKTPKPADDPRTWAAGIVTGGGAPIVGDYLFGSINRFGQGPIIGALGPLTGRGDNLAEIMLNSAHNHKYAWNDDVRSGLDPRSRAGADAVGWIKGVTPGANLWFAEGAINYLFVHSIQEALNPGYLRKMEKKLERQNKQEYFIKPSKIWDR